MEENQSDDFKSYASITNVTNRIFIDKAIEHNPFMCNMSYIVTEKVDGANIQILFNKDGSYKVGSRNKWLNDGERFFDIWGAIDRGKPMIDYFISCATKVGPLTIYCELCGPSINRRVNYGPEQHLILLDVIFSGLSANLSSNLQLVHWLPPLIGMYNNLEDAINVNCEFDSRILNIPNNPAEGVVIKRYFPTNPWAPCWDFRLKKINPLFAKVKSTPKNLTPVQKTELQEKFVTYITENRMLSVFSKEGPIEDVRNLTKYIGLIMDDAKVDFMRDNPMIEDNRTIYKYGGNLASGLLRGYMSSGNNC